jgi:hypothetical protein
MKQGQAACSYDVGTMYVSEWRRMAMHASRQCSCTPPTRSVVAAAVAFAVVCAVLQLIIKHLVKYRLAGGPVPSSSLDAWKIQLARTSGG